MPVIAVIFDFDDTLVPDSTSRLLESHGIDPEPFWRTEAKELYDRGYDPPLAYLKLLLERTGPNRPLGSLSNADLRRFGATLDGVFFPGLPDLFVDLRESVSRHRDISIEFYIISGGLEEVIGGSTIVQQHFQGIYGCQFGEDPATGIVTDVKRCITFTEKTRYLFEINKGISPADSKTKAHLVNLDVAEDDRRVPFDQMVYVGDGLTDVPCFSLVNKHGGTPFGVFKPGAESAKQAFQRFLATGRVRSLHSPDYRAEADLGALIRAAVESIALKIELKTQRPV